LIGTIWKNLKKRVWHVKSAETNTTSVTAEAQVGKTLKERVWHVKSAKTNTTLVTSAAQGRKKTLQMDANRLTGCFPYKPLLN
jgi:ribosomal protein S11